jgi:endonuclease/exonuclease/phosphatase family metal-dependent hydrolase
MRFLLYNVRYCTGTGGPLHLPWGGYLMKRTTQNLRRIAAFIHSCHPDIVGLLEADAGSYRSDQTNQVAAIAQVLGHYHVYESKYAQPSLARAVPILNKQVNAFLCSDVIQRGKFHYFDRGIKRLVIQLDLRDLTLFLVHLSIRFKTRHSQLGDLYSLVKEVTKPCIVAGDFNVFRGGREMKLFLAATGLRNACSDGRASFPSWKPRRQLDFILHNGGIQVTHFQMPRVQLSDHLPLLCDFEIKR